MKKTTTIICVMLAALMLLAGCSGQPANITQLSDLEGKTVAMLSTPHDPANIQAVLERQTEVEFKELLFFENCSAAIAALKSGKADAVFISGSPVLEYYTSRDASLESVTVPSTGMAAYHMAMRADDTEICENINAALIAMKEDGTLTRLEKEFITDLTPDIQLAGKDMPRFDDAPTLLVGLAGDNPPIDYIAADGKPAGYNVELLSLLAAALQVNIEISVMPTESKFPALASGKIDVFFLHPVVEEATELAVTLEANSNVKLTEAYYEFNGIGYLILK